MCVSKLFNSVISDPAFERTYMQRAHSSPESSASTGLLPTLLCPLPESSCKGHYSKNIKKLADAVDQSSTEFLHHHHHGLSINVYTDCHDIIGSSNGLILYRIRNRYPGMKRSFSLCVSNPLTKQSVRLPDPCSINNINGEFLMFGIVTRRRSSLTYKVVVIHHMVEIFSSDTGRWASWQVYCPLELLVKGCTSEPGAPYRGILHWLDWSSGDVITYDPYDHPDRFARILCPGLYQGGPRSLIYSGDQEMLKYCEIEENGTPGFDRDLLWLWRLVDSSGKGDQCWCLEGKFSVSSTLLDRKLDRYFCNQIMVAPNPWSRDVICHPFVTQNGVTVNNLTTGTRENVDVFIQGRCPLIPIELCPWSCPFYAQSS